MIRFIKISNMGFIGVCLLLSVLVGSSRAAEKIFKFVDMTHSLCCSGMGYTR